MSKNSIMNSISLKKSPTSDFNRKIFNRSNTTKIDIEKAHYEAKLLLDEEEDSFNLENQFVFKRKNISIFKFFCHLCEPIDWLYLILGIIGLLICASAGSVLAYLNATVYSDIGNTSENRGSLSEEEIMKLKVKKTMNDNIKQKIVCGVISFVGDMIGYFFFGLMGTRVLYNFKKRYFKLLLSQELGWFDSTNVFEFSSKIQSQLEYIELGIGEMLSNIIVDFFIALISFIFAFFGSCKLSLVISCFLPLIIILAIIFDKVNIKGNSLVRQTWELAGGIGEEIFYNIKTVVSFSNFEYELKRFYEKVEISNKIELVINFRLRLIIGILYFISGLIFFISILYGRSLIGKDYNSFRGRDLTGGDITLTFTNMLSFILTLVSFVINLLYLQFALASTSDYFNLYERKPEIDLSTISSPIFHIFFELKLNKFP